MSDHAQSLDGFIEHPARAIALGELHARPALRLPDSALALRYVFTGLPPEKWSSLMYGL